MGEKNEPKILISIQRINPVHSFPTYVNVCVCANAAAYVDTQRWITMEFSLVSRCSLESIISTASWSDVKAKNMEKDKKTTL